MTSSYSREPSVELSLPSLRLPSFFGCPIPFPASDWCVILFCPESVAFVENRNIVATITNTGDETAKVLNYPSGPLSKLPTDTFAITDATGAQPSFTGIEVKFVFKTAAALGDYTILAPGESVEVEHNLAHAYNFTAPGVGNHDIHARNIFYVVNNDETISHIYPTPRLTQLRFLESSHLPDPPHPRQTGDLRRMQCSPADLPSWRCLGCSGATLPAPHHTLAPTPVPRLATQPGSALTPPPTRYCCIPVLGHQQQHFLLYTFDCTCTDSGTYAGEYLYVTGFTPPSQ
ncbi:hypothetical protein BDZ97DRAFT_2059311 [Flammula alnicola]|nr:hypothetical protein BDZ97DRAFT_2059311 [Flammula alnicola]